MLTQEAGPALSYSIGDGECLAILRTYKVFLSEAETRLREDVLGAILLHAYPMPCLHESVVTHATGTA